MKKFLLLVASLTLSIQSYAQIDTLYEQYFDDPSQLPNLNTYATNGAVGRWKDTTNVSISSPNSYFGQIEKGPNIPANTAIIWQSDFFSTVGKRYVFIDFWHICKLFIANRGTIEVTTDGGANWTEVNTSNSSYIGNAPFFVNTFNEASYTDAAGNDIWRANQDVAVAQSWFQYEKFDISNLALDTATSTGYSQVAVRFLCTRVLNPTNEVPPRQYGRWYIDNVVITGASCELYPPKLNWEFLSSVCPRRPEGQILDPQNNDSSYTIAVEVSDTARWGDSGVDSVWVKYRLGGSTPGPWQTKTFALYSTSPNGVSEYRVKVTGLVPGDTVDYRVYANDFGCPNVTVSPDSLSPNNYYYQFIIIPGLPFKCGTPNCSTAPGTIKTFPWVEDFEGSEWSAANANSTGEPGDVENFRGNFPDEEYGMRYWKLAPTDLIFNQYAWCIKSGGPTFTPYTGPPSNHTPGGGKYLYAESSINSIPPSTRNSARVITPCIDLSQETRCLHFEFYYHMFGRDIGNLQVRVDTGADVAALFPVLMVTGAQQNFPNDPWKRASIDLTPYNGKIIRIAIDAVHFSPDDRGDIAVDDFRIYEPDPADAELIEFVTPFAGMCSYSSSEPVEVVIKNNSACNTIQNFPISFQVNNNPVQTEMVTTAIPPAGTINYVLTKTASLSGLQNYVVKAWTDLNGDLNADNDTILTDSILHKLPYNSFPLLARFNSPATGSNQTGHSYLKVQEGLAPNFKFTVGEEMTPTRHTGPYSGQYLGGKYLYTEGDGSTGDISTYLRTDGCIDITNLSDPVLDFFYHSYADDIESVSIQVSKSDEDYLTWTDISGSARDLTLPANRQTHELNPWKYYRLSLARFLPTGSDPSPTLKLRVVVTRRDGLSLTDFAIDNFVIYDRISQDAGVTRITAPDRYVIANEPLGNNASVFVRNFGSAAISGAQVEFSVTPLCGPNQGVTTTYTAAQGANVNLAAESSVSLNMPNMTLPVGDCKVCAYTILTGDNANFNDTVCKIITGTTDYRIGFVDNFDSCDYDRTGFYGDGVNGNTHDTYYQWQHGVPVGGAGITSAATSPNSWVTDLDGVPLDNTVEVLYTPSFHGWDTLDLVGTKIRFSQNTRMPSGAAGFVQYQRNRAGAWSTLGASRLSITIDDTNWYFNNSFSNVSMNPDDFFNSPQPGFTGNSGGWRYTRYQMNELNRTADDIRFRFLYITPENSVGATSGGWGIDNFEIFIPPQHSTRPVKLSASNPLPLPFQPLTFSTVVRNTGKQLLTGYQIQIDMDGVPLGWDTISGLSNDPTNPSAYITERKQHSHDYSHEWSANFVTSGTHQALVYTRFPNEEDDDFTPDDTLEVNIEVLGEFEFNDVDTVYCNDFEPNNGVFPFLHYNSYIYQDGNDSWQKGRPVQFGGTAVSGDNVWMTGTQQNYKPRDSSALFTPVFNVDSGMTFMVSFMHWFETEKYHDGGTFDASLNGGKDWYTIGWPGEPDWFNTQFVTALDIIKPGWTDTSGGWIPAQHTIRFDTAAQVIFRFRFESDYTYEDAGWAIDDFCMRMIDPDENAWTIGVDQYVPNVETYIGELSPNPAKEITHLPIMTSEPKKLKFTVVNILGQLVKTDEMEIEAGTHEWNLNTERYKPGIYIINVEMDGEKYTRKLVVR